MKKTLLCLVSIMLFAINCWSVIGEVRINKGLFEGTYLLGVTSTGLTILLSTDAMNTSSDYLFKNDEDSPSTIYVSTDTNFLTGFATWSSQNLFLQSIATNTLVSGTSVWTSGILIKNPNTNVTADINFTVGTATTVVRGTCTIQGLNDSYVPTTEIIEISTTTATGSVIWTSISTVSWKCTNLGNTTLKTAFCEILTGSSNSAYKLKGNVWKLHVGESISAQGSTYGTPIYGKVIEAGSNSQMCIIKYKIKD